MLIYGKSRLVTQHTVVLSEKDFNYASLRADLMMINGTGLPAILDIKSAVNFFLVCV